METASYAAFGYTIRTWVPLPAPRAASDDPDVRIRRATVDVPELNRDRDRHVLWSEERAHLWYADVGAFTVRVGTEILVEPIQSVPDRLLRFRVAGAAMGVLLYQRGHLVLHGSCVAIDGAAVAFLGPSTAGKSTTAAAFHDAGYPVLADDLTAVTIATSAPTVHPGYPAVKLDGSAAALITRATACTDGRSDRRYYRLDRDRDAPTALSRVYMLTDGPAPAVEPIGGSEAVVTLAYNTYVRRLLDHRTEKARHFEQCARVANGAAVRWLVRPDDLDALDAVVRAVEADLRDKSGGE